MVTIDKKQVIMGAAAVGCLAFSGIWWAGLRSNLGISDLVARITACACPAGVKPVTPACTGLIQKLLPPGLTVANFTIFCTDPQSILTETRTSSQVGIVTNALAGTFMDITGLIWAGVLTHDIWTKSRQYSQI